MYCVHGFVCFGDDANSDDSADCHLLALSFSLSLTLLCMCGFDPFGLNCECGCPCIGQQPGRPTKWMRMRILDHMGKKGLLGDFHKQMKCWLKIHRALNEVLSLIHI